MRIGQLAQATGISADTIRYYEKIGLLPSPPRSDAGYREYPSGANTRIRVIRNAAQLGFPLKEIAKVLRVRDSGGAPCQQVRDYARHLIDEIDQRLVQLRRDRASMMTMIRGWDRQLKQAHGGQAHLLESHGLPVRSARPKSARLRRTR